MQTGNFRSGGNEKRLYVTTQMSGADLRVGPKGAHRHYAEH